MIKFKNGHEMDFGCASGALAWYGEGWWWEHPLRWMGFIRPDQLTIISKTLTYEPRIGNLKMWCPWRCVRLVGGGAVNAVGLTNPGYQWWLNDCCSKIEKKNWKVIVSIMPQGPYEAYKMTQALNSAPVVGIELNLSCPNVDHDFSIKHIKTIVEETLAVSKHPIIVKLAYQDPYVDICKELDGKVEAFDLINTIPWNKIYNKPSPLAKYNLQGGVSGLPIKKYAVDALVNVIKAGIKTPVISGGGIDSANDVYLRYAVGAEAFTFGTLFLRNPIKPRVIVNECRRAWSLIEKD